jgi:hypothetical protein
MPFDIEAGTDVAFFAIFDPGAVIGHIKSDWGEVDHLADDARAAFYSFSSDGSQQFRIFVNEPLDPRLVPRAVDKVMGHLRVPTGSVWIIGAEYMPNEQVKSADEYKPAQYMGGFVDLPAGNYRIEAGDLLWREEEPEAMLRSRASDADFRFESAVGCTTGALLFGNVLGLPALFIGLWTQIGFWAAMQGLGWLVLADVLLAVPLALLWKSKRMGRAIEAREAIREQTPGAYVVLTRCEDEAEMAGARGVRFGSGYVNKGK